MSFATPCFVSEALWFWTVLSVFLQYRPFNFTVIEMYVVVTSPLFHPSCLLSLVVCLSVCCGMLHCQFGGMFGRNCCVSHSAKKKHLSPSLPSKPLSMSGSGVFCKKYVQFATVLSQESWSTRLQVQSYCLVVLNK